MSTFVNHDQPFDPGVVLGQSAAAPQPIQPFATVGGQHGSVPVGGPGKISTSGGGVSSNSPAPKQPLPYGGVYTKQQYNDDQDQSFRNDSRRASNASNDANLMHQMQNPGDQSREGGLMAGNNALVDLARSGNGVAASRIQDTDALIASARGDSPGTEYVENGDSPSGSPNIAAVPGTGSGNIVTKPR
jgi:hypothetical protein